MRFQIFLTDIKIAIWFMTSANDNLLYKIGIFTEQIKLFNS